MPDKKDSENNSAEDKMQTSDSPETNAQGQVIVVSEEKSDCRFPKAYLLLRFQ